MKKAILPFIIIFFIFTACDVEQTSHIISLEDVINALEEEKLELEKKSDSTKSSYFTFKYNKVEPALYDLNGKLLSIYIYDSVEEREDGLRAFEDTIAGFTEPYLIYEVKNALIIYVDSEYKYDEDIKKAINELESI